MTRFTKQMKLYGVVSNRKRTIGWILVAAVFAVATALRADSVLNSKHDLSVTGPGPIKAATESEVCLFCHTPHRGTGDAPLWNHAMSAATYTPYFSSTIKATVGQPTGSSKLCLSCHDGTVALGMIQNPNTTIAMQSGVTTMPAGPSRLGTDLSDDHPVSLTYDSALASANGELKDPSTLTEKVRLDENNQLQCTSCHNPHDDQYGKFLVKPNVAGELCNTCHDKSYWSTSSHATSTKTWNGAPPDPWPHTENTTVAANACESCHAPHNAGTKPRLLNFALEEDNCFSCHNGHVAAKNLEPEFNKFSVHPIADTTGIHDPTEDIVNGPRHVECADCHNAHAAKSQAAIAPSASGALAGVKGITSAGTLINPLTKDYELCFRCHADSISRGPALVNRQFVQTNTRLEFDPGNASYHPIVSAGKNPNVPSLISPMTTATIMYCGDCHNNDQGPGNGGSGPKGPHGSNYRPILERQLDLTDDTTESPAAYALCYKCHSRSSILANESFPTHYRHVVTDKIACTSCHDPHGVQNAAHLINFNRDYATPSSRGLLEFVDQGTLHGNCSMTCHGHDHDRVAY